LCGTETPLIMNLYYEQAVTTDPYFKDAWGNLGITYEQLNDLINAELVFLKAIELSPNNAQLNCLLD